MLNRLFGRKTANQLSMTEYAPIYQKGILLLADHILDPDAEDTVTKNLPWARAATSQEEFLANAMELSRESGVEDLARLSEEFKELIPVVPKGVWNLHVSTLRVTNSYLSVISAVLSVLGAVNPVISGHKHGMEAAEAQASRAMETFNEDSQRLGRDIERIRESNPTAYRQLGLVEFMAKLAS